MAQICLGKVYIGGQKGALEGWGVYGLPPISLSGTEAAKCQDELHRPSFWENPPLRNQLDFWNTTALQHQAKQGASVSGVWRVRGSARALRDGNSGRLGRLD